MNIVSLVYFQTRQWTMDPGLCKRSCLGAQARRRRSEKSKLAIYHFSCRGPRGVLAQDRICTARAEGGVHFVIDLRVALAAAGLVGGIAHALVAVHEACFAECVPCDRATARGWRRARQGHGLGQSCGLQEGCWGWVARVRDGRRVAREYLVFAAWCVRVLATVAAVVVVRERDAEWSLARAAAGTLA